MNEDNRKRVNLIGLINHTVFTFGISIMIFIFSGILVKLFNENRIIEIAHFLPFLTLAFIPKAYCQKIIYRDQKMFLLFISNLIFFGINTIILFYFIWINNELTFSTLSISYIISSVCSSVAALIIIRHELKFSLKGKISLKQIFNFNWKMTIVSMLYSLPRQLDAVFIKVFFPLETIGLYSAAKTIFRVFDESMNAVTALVYPSAVRYINKGQFDKLQKMITKVFSFGFIIFLLTSFIMINGASNFFFHLSFFPAKYLPSLNYFNLLVLSIPLLPFNITFSIMVAHNKMFQIMGLIAICVLICFISIGYIGMINATELVPLGLTIYYFSSGLIGLFYSMKNYNFKITSIFSSIIDFKNYFFKSS